MRLPSVCQILTIWRKHKVIIVFATVTPCVLLGWYKIQQDLSYKFQEYENVQLDHHAHVEKSLSDANARKKAEGEKNIW